MTVWTKDYAEKIRDTAICVCGIPASGLLLRDAATEILYMQEVQAELVKALEGLVGADHFFATGAIDRCRAALALVRMPTERAGQ